MTLVLFLAGCIGCHADWRDHDGDLFSPQDGDCDDENPDINPGAEEDWYNGVDENCDGNDGDQDGDGFVPDHYVEEFPDWMEWPEHLGPGDCWDDPTMVPSFIPVALNIDAFEVHPDAHDIPKDGADQDCDGSSDYDEDGDGHDCPDGNPGGTDCDDTDAEVHPEAEEVCNGKDDDCDGTIDQDASDCTVFYADGDGDGLGLGFDSLCLCEPDGHYTAEDPGDCDDNDPNTYTGADEICDGRDNDCDGDADEDAIDASTWYTDGDGDGVGDASVLACDQPEDAVDIGGDCNDNDATVYPGSHYTETPGDGIDQDCDGVDACSDWDCDGIADIIVTHFYDSEANSYSGYGQIWSGASGWSDSTSFYVEGGHRLLVEDLDDDGYQDLVVANHFSNTTFLVNSYVYWGGANGLSNQNRTHYPTSAAVWPVTGDFNGDGHRDLAFSNHHDNSTYVVDSIVFYGDGGGPSTNSFVELPTLGSYEALAQDLDGDGYDDLVFANTGDDASYEVDSVIYWGSANGLSSGDATYLPTTGAFSVVAADVDGDGLSDLAFASYIDDDGSYALDSLVYLNSQSGFSESNVLYLDTVGAYWVRAADLDNDGYDDLVLPSYYNGSFSLDSHIYWGSSAGPTNSDVTELTTKGAMEPLLTDLDQDGYTDIVFANARSNSTYGVDSSVYWGSSSGYSSFDETELPTSGAHAAAAGDLDGDGYIDLVFSNYLDAGGSRLDSPIYWGDSTWSGGSSQGLYSVGNYAPVIIVQ